MCKVAQDANVPAVTSMFEENPGVLTYRSEVLIAAGAEDVKGMEPALVKLAELAVKLGNGVTLGPAESEGYFPRGARKEGRRYASAATRAGDMLMARLTGSPWTTELLLETPRRHNTSGPGQRPFKCQNRHDDIWRSGAKGQPGWAGERRFNALVEVLDRWPQRFKRGRMGVDPPRVLCRDNERRAQLRNAARRDETARRRRRHCRNSPDSH